MEVEAIEDDRPPKRSSSPVALLPMLGWLVGFRRLPPDGFLSPPPRRVERLVRPPLLAPALAMLSLMVCPSSSVSIFLSSTLSRLFPLLASLASLQQLQHVKRNCGVCWTRQTALVLNCSLDTGYALFIVNQRCLKIECLCSFLESKANQRVSTCEAMCAS